MGEQLYLQDPNVRTLWVLTDTLDRYVKYIKELGGIVEYESQAMYRLGRFTVHWLDIENFTGTLKPQAPGYCLVVLGPDWDKAEERWSLSSNPDNSVRGWLRDHYFRFAYSRDLRNCEEVGV